MLSFNNLVEHCIGKEIDLTEGRGGERSSFWIITRGGWGGGDLDGHVKFQYLWTCHRRDHFFQLNSFIRWFSIRLRGKCFFSLDSRYDKKGLLVSAVHVAVPLSCPNIETYIPAKKLVWCKIINMKNQKSELHSYRVNFPCSMKTMHCLTIGLDLNSRIKSHYYLFIMTVIQGLQCRTYRLDRINIYYD